MCDYQAFMVSLITFAFTLSFAPDGAWQPRFLLQKKIVKNAFRFLLFTKKICIFATTLLCPSCASLHRGDNDAPKRKIFLSPQKTSHQA